MSNASQSPIPTPPTQRRRDFRQRHLPWLVWGAALIICVAMLAGRASRFEVVALAQAVQFEISASATGRLDSVEVDLFDRVEAGAIIARLEDGEIDARLRRSQATIRQLTAELGAAREQFAATGVAERAAGAVDLRRFQADEEGRRLAALELEVTVESDEIQLEGLALDMGRAAPLLEAGLIGRSEYDHTKLLHDEVRTRVEENRQLLAETEAEYRSARVRREQFERGLPELPAVEPLLRPLQEAITVENERLAEIRARREATILRSPIAGIVTQVLCRQGQSVVPGESIATVTEPVVSEVLAFLDERDRRVIRHNDAVLVSSVTRPGSVAKSVVVRVAPGTDVIPQRLWRDPGVPQYGRAVVIASVPGLGVEPGEMLRVRFPRSR